MPSNETPKLKSKLHRSHNDELHDLVCVGFGPSGLAIAVALHDALAAEDTTISGVNPKIRFLERQANFSWHAGMLIPGAKMQISFLKDMATFRDPQSKFTFLNYLHKNRRLVRFSNLGTFLPQRIEYQDYMRWCAEHFANVVDYGQNVTKVKIDQQDPMTGAVASWLVISTNVQTGEITHTRARHVVIGAGGQPQMPEQLRLADPRVIHSSQYATYVPKLFPKGTQPAKVAVIGGGQSAAEIFYDVPNQFPGTQSIMVVRDSALRPSDDSPFVNEIFDPEAVDEFFSRDAASRAKALEIDRATNYGVVRLQLLEDIYSQLYAYGLQYKSPELWPHRILFQREVAGLSENRVDGESSLQLQLEDASKHQSCDNLSRREILDVGLVIVACGYTRTAHDSILNDVRHLTNGKKWTVKRNYAVEFREGTVRSDAGIWLQGCNEKTHGLSDSLLSVLAIRGAEMVDNIFGQADAWNGDDHPEQRNKGYHDFNTESSYDTGLSQEKNGHHEANGNQICNHVGIAPGLGSSSARFNSCSELLRFGKRPNGSTGARKSIHRGTPASTKADLIFTKMVANMEGGSQGLNGHHDHGKQTTNGVEFAREKDLKRIWEWNKQVPETLEQCIHTIFAQRVKEHPGAPAICAWDGDLTYTQLDELSTKLAHHLISLGLTTGSLVPLCLEKSVWMSVAVLGVMKAGGASVALDVTLPEGRLRTIAEQTRSTLIVSSPMSQELARQIMGDDTMVVIPELLQGKQLSNNDIQTILPVVNPSEKLYVVFTSGSTGTPKGAIITHSNFASAHLHEQKALGFTRESRVWDFVSYAFDVSWSNILHTLTSGACLCVPSQEQRQSDFAGSIRKLRANLADITPSIGRLMDPAQVPGLQLVNFSGEVLTTDDVTRWRSVPTVLNSYGPAECSVRSTAGKPIDCDAPDVSIGWSIGSNSWVVEPEKGQELVPIGSIGELWLEGPIVGSGYLGDSEKTAATFVQDPIWLLRGGPGVSGRRGRLYKTGDLVKYNDNGSLEFIGRKDSQVKIRGQRVELGEVEHHVRKNFVNGADIQMAAEVITPEGRDPMLVVFVKVNANHHPTEAEQRTAIMELTSGLEAKLIGDLPSYEIPVAYIPVVQIPMTATGKTDRRQLRSMGASMTLEHLANLNPTRGEKREPSTEMERKIQTLWAAILRVDPGTISANDSFTRIGGDSIAMIQLVAAAREDGLVFSVADIFKQTRLVDLAKVVREARADDSDVVEPFSLLSAEGQEHDARHAAAQSCSIKPTQIEDMFPCTPLQEGLLALTVKSSETGGYTSRNALPLRDDVDLDRFIKAWEHLVASTPILRTRIIDLPGEKSLTQAVIADKLQWRHAQNIESLIKEDELEPMGLGKPLARFGIVDNSQSSGGKRYFMWTIHHALYDGWLMALLTEHAERAYRREPTRKLTSFPSFIKHGLDIDRDSVTQYWQSQLADSGAVPYPAIPPASYEASAGQTLYHEIAGVSWPRTGITPTTAVRAAWTILSSSYSNSRAVVFGATVAGRQGSLLGVEYVAGPTIATVPIQLRIENEQTVESLLQKIQTQAIDMADFEQTGLQRIRSISSDISQASQFQTLVVVQPPKQEVNSALFEDGQTDIGNDGGLGVLRTYPLTLECQLTKAGLLLKMRYDPGLVQQPERLARQFELVLRQICDTARAETKLADVKLLTEQDLGDILKWNSATQIDILDSCIHEIVSQKARVEPNRSAICAWDGELTFAELEDLSTRLAQHLLRSGVNRGDMVPICFEKSLWVTVAMLGVNKAGAAFVPLDPSFPKARKDDILSQTEARVIVTSAGNASTFSKSSIYHTVVVCAEMFQGTTDGINGVQNHVSVSDPGSIAYVIFTSGSTGRPKGVVMEHRAVVTSCKAHGRALKFGPDTRSLQFSSYTFDACIIEIVTTLMYGGCVCIPSDSERVSNLASAMNRLQVTWTLLTPTVARLLEPKELTSLRQLALGAEAVLEQDLTQWKDSVHLFEAYGPTECAVICFVQDLGLNPSSSASVIGKGEGAISWLVDPQDHNKLAPPGAIGELLIQGPNLARGYLGDERKTAEAFIENPAWLDRMSDRQFQSQRPVRMYKTGDLVRYQQDGSLEFIGRKDVQTKIRGQRVELGEVEHYVRQVLTDMIQGKAETLGSHISTVAEIITPQDSSAPILVAFIGQGTSEATQSEGKNWSLIQPELAAELEQALAERLPIYMIPTAFIHINAIPLTVSGKTDRKRLRNTGASMALEQLTGINSAERKRQPTTDMERQLQSLWASVLGIEQSRIGTDDSFLRIGGDSVSAMRLAAAAHKQNLSLTVASVFKHPRLSQLAQVVTQSNSAIEEHIEAFSQLRSGSSRDEARLQAARICNVAVDGIEDIFPCTPLQQGLLALTAKRPGDYIHEESLNVRPDVDTARLRAAWEEVILTAPILRTRIIDLPGQGLVQVVLSADQVGWTKVNEETDINEFAPGDKDLAMGLGTPLARFSLNGNSFLLTLHHAVYDGWSLSLIFQQLEKAYQNPHLEASPPFQRFVKHILGVEQERMTGYWQHQLDGAESAALFPTLPSTSYEPQTDEQIVRQISNVSWNKTDMTASTIIRAAWAVLFARYMDTTDVAFGAVVMGRQVANVSGIEHMIGPTIATVPVRISLDWHQTIDSLLKQVQTQTTEMAEFEHVGLGKIRQINRDCELATQFQTLVAVQPKDLSNDSVIFKPRDEDTYDRDAMAAFGTYAFTPVCNLEADGLQLQLNFDSHVVESAQVERISSQFEHLVRNLCDPDHASLGLANVMTASPQDLQDIWAWNATVPSSADRLVHEMIDETIQSHPLSQAVCAWDGDLTYKELDCLATRVSRHLIENLGIGPGTIVPLYLDKSMWVPVAMLGVMKAGAASVALDVTQPEQRLKAIVDQVDAVTVLCSEPNADRASELFPEVKTVEVDSLCSKDGPQPPLPDALVPSVKPTDPVYTVFTSGSTGVPKGVIITHANFTSAFVHQTRQLGFTEKSRVFDFASYAFDASWYHILHTFHAGGCLCVPSEDERRNDTSGAILRMKPTFANLTPKVAELLEPEALKTFELIELGGESADVRQVAHVKKYTNFRFAYGPAECTVVSTVSEENVSRTTIGRGYGTCTWVVDTVTETSLAPLGCVGELWIEGPMVGRGYLNDQTKTAESFVKDPSWLLYGASGYPGRHGRVYKTGDLVRYQADGSLMFVGRKDTQVKIRGQRVELSEVEHHIHQCLTSQTSEEGKPSEGLQIVAEVVSDNSKLVAFVVPPGGAQMSDAERELAVKNMTRGLEDSLSAVVPPYMIPAGYIPLGSVPMTTTGKTDRVSLRRIGASANLQTTDARGQEFVDTQNEIESSIRSIWAKVLNMDPSAISTTARFIRLGGDSITAMQVVSRSRQHNIHFTVGEVLGLQTIQRIAEKCREKRESSAVNGAASLLQSGETTRAWPLSPVQRMIFSFHPTGLNHFNQSFTLKINRAVEDDALLTASQSLVTRHSMLRTRFRQNGDGEWEQYAEPYTPDVYAFRKHGDVQSVDQIESTAQSRQANFDIQNGPVFAVDAFRLFDGQQVMLLSAHHLVVDLVSWRIIWNDLEQCLRGQRLMPPPTSFLAWSQVQQDRSRELRSPADVLPYEVEPTQPDFWGVKPRDNTVGRQITLEASIDTQTTALLLGQSTDALRCEPLDILAAAVLQTFQGIFSERARVPPLIIEGHGREASGDEGVDLSETVGWFTTLYPLQVTNDAIRKDDLTHLVKVVKDLRKTVPGKGQPYFAARYNSELGKQSFGDHDQAELLLNYAGVYQQLESSDSVFSRFNRPDGGNLDLKVTSPDVRRVALIEVEAAVEHDELRMEFIFSQDMKHQERLEQWTKLVQSTLKDICHQLANERHSFTLADLPLVNISYTGLKALFEEQLAGIGVEVSQIKDIYPCTPLQEGILMSQKRGTASYATNFVWSCESNHDGSLVLPAALEKAWRLTAQRHSILSTIFVDHPETGGMLQVVLENPEDRIQQLESGQVDPVQALQSLPTPTFTPNQPQWSVTICSRPGTGQVACRLDISHAMSDAASMSIIAQDVANAYSGQNMPTAPEFREVVEAIQQQPREERLAYWAEFLAKAQPCHFPTIGQADGPSTSDSSDGEYGFLPVVAPDVSGRIYDFCRGRGITRSELLQVAWALSLSQYLAVDQVCFGYLTSGRNTQVNNIEQLVGPVINMLVGFIDVSKGLDDVLDKTHGDSINHFAHQHTSLAEIHRELGGFSGKRLFNTTVTVLTEDEEEQAKGGAKDLWLQVRGGVDPHEYDLALSASQKGHHTDLVLNYRRGSVSDYTASEVGQLLESAIRFILEAADPNSDAAQSATPGTGNLQSDFIQWRFGANDAAVREFWQKQFQDAHAVHFPPISSAAYIARADRTLEYDCGKIKLSEGSPWSAMTMAWAAWSIVAAEATNSSELVFGALIQTPQTSQKPGGRATACVPIQVALQAELTVEEFHRLLEEKTDEIAQYPHISLQEISTTSEAAKQCCQFQTLISVHSTTKTQRESEVLPNSAMSVNFAQRENNATTLSFSFDTKVVEEELVARLAGRLKRVIQQQSDPAHASTKITDLVVLGEQDLSDIWQWNATVPTAADQCVHEMFTETASERPTAPAVCAWNGQLTYGELDVLSTRLAYHLMSLGVGPESVVPLCFEKSLLTPVAMLAVMKAGGASVALDVTQPEERLRAIFKQVNAKITLSSVDGARLASHLGGNEIPNISIEKEDLLALPAVELSGLDAVQPSLPVIDSSSMIYLAFTSGSTGEPKGVMITHSNFASAIRYQREALEFTPSSRVYDFASYAFDVAWYNAFQTLTAGGCLCVPSEHQRKNELPASILELQANSITLTPTVAELLDASILKRLRIVELGGEAVREAHIDRISAHTKVRIAYGPVECTAGATWASKDIHDSNIGHPLGACVWVVDAASQGRLAAVGSIGELWIEGPLTRLGY
ncbi:hypothetical protein NM208_g6548 [Fusarium decemcellulare]|uniref:Uncharacterized protein n=1 Tax=Fusarium decemcellulare TaxID=57161 RepID=A0ACC1SCK0_9HYPO|nr:hypothetical protein NM208_g6548 [Fusarium decemcellulare]